MSTKTCCPIPSWPRYMGMLGAMPFFLLAAASLPQGPWRLASQDGLLLYAAIMLTFISFMHMGILHQTSTRGQRHTAKSYRLSLLPALLGWAALLLPPGLAVTVILGGFWMHYLHDRGLSGRLVLPEWYLPTRFALTTAASLSLLLGGVAILLGGVPLPLAGSQLFGFND